MTNIYLFTVTRHSENMKIIVFLGNRYHADNHEGPAGIQDLQGELVPGVFVTDTRRSSRTFSEKEVSQSNRIIGDHNTFRKNDFPDDHNFQDGPVEFINLHQTIQVHHRQLPPAGRGPGRWPGPRQQTIFHWPSVPGPRSF